MGCDFDSDLPVLDQPLHGIKFVGHGRKLTRTLRVSVIIEGCANPTKTSALASPSTKSRMMSLFARVIFVWYG